MQVAELLVNELQLGQQLNHAVSEGQRGEFGLLLAMLSKDVQDQAQFHLEDTSEVLFEQPKLREQFQLPPEQPLVADEMGESYSLALGQVAQQQGLTAARLMHASQPAALDYEMGMREGLSEEIFDNLGPHTAARFTGKTKVPTQAPVDIEQLVRQQQEYTADLVA